MNTSCLFFVLLAFLVAVTMSALSSSSFISAAVPEYPADLLAPYTENEIKWLQDEDSANDVPEFGDVSLPQAANDVLLNALANNNKNIKKSSQEKDADMYQDKQSPSLLVFFFAPWCNHCSAVKPIFKNASASVALSSLSTANIGIKKTKDGKRVAAPYSRRGSSFSLVDATTHKLAANTFHVTSFPTFTYFMPVLSWNEKGEAVPRMVGLPYGSGRDAQSFEFVARYLDLGLRRGFIAPAQHMVDIMSLKKVEPPRVLFIVGPAANTTSLWKSVAPPAFVAASLTNGKSHFASYAAIEQTVSESSKIKIPEEVQKNPEHKSLFINMVEAYNKVTKGPGGEFAICLSDIDEINGAIPYTGKWPENSLPDKIPQPQKKKESSSSTTDATAVDQEEQQAVKEETSDELIEKLAAEAGMKNLYVREVSSPSSSGVVRWIQQHSLLPIEQISPATFQQIAQEGRYVALAVTKGTTFGRNQHEINQEAQRASATLLTYLQRRRARHQLEERNRILNLEKENENLAEVPVPAKKSNKKGKKKTASSVTEIIETSTALPFPGADGSIQKVFLGVLDGGVFTEFLSDLGVKETPTFILYDTEESSVFYEPEALSSLADLQTAWNSNGNNNKESTDDITLLQNQVADAIEVFVSRAENGEIVDKPINLMGRVARFMTDYVPGMYKLKVWMAWDATQLVAIVGGVGFSFVVMLLAGRPSDDDQQQQGGGRRMTEEELMAIDENTLSSEEKKAFAEYKRRVLAKRKRDAEKKKVVEGNKGSKESSTGKDKDE